MSQYLVNKYFNPLLDVINSTSENLEIELRFQGLITFTQFKRVNDYLLEKFKTPVIEHTQDSKLNNIRQTIQDNKDGSFSYTNIIKKSIKPFFDRDLLLKLDVSSETSISTNEKIVNPDIIRDKHRQTWRLESYFLQIDLTSVNQIEKGKNPESKYEIEIELIGDFLSKRDKSLNEQQVKALKTGLINMSSIMINFKKLIQDSDIVYRESEKMMINEYINNNLYRLIPRDRRFFNKSEQMNDSIFAQAKNLKFRNLQYGQLLNTEEKSYSVTVKADGMRKLLIVHESGIWLAYKRDYCRVTSELNNAWKPYIGTILDGEDVPIDKRRVYLNSKHLYLPYDTLMFKGVITAEESLKSRLNYTKAIRSLGPIFTPDNQPLLITEEKPFFFFEDTFESFSNAITKVKTMLDKNYLTDGLIFTPNTKYNSPKESIYKWKPFEEQTIDLKYITNVSERALYASKGDLLIKFVGKDNFIFDAETQVDWLDPMFNSIPPNSIVEFEPKIIGDIPATYQGRYILRPKKIRSDKQYPNSIQTAMDVWEDINSPIEFRTLLGEDTTLLKKYHNRVKRDILNKTEKNSYLIDIGSGRGGDLTKFNNFDKVLCIEPDKDNLNELIRRLNESENKLSSKVSVLQSGGEESVKIVEKVKETFTNFVFDNKPRTLYISMMLSLSFFFQKDDKMLNHLIKTINGIRKYYYDSLMKINPSMVEKGQIKFIFLTIEGTRTLELMKKYNNEFNHNGWHMKFDPVKEIVYIHIDDSIVQNQTEYLVDLNKLNEKLQGNIEYIYTTNEEKFLSKYEMDIASMYVYGSINLRYMIQ